jgi:hypothetical protein
VASGRKRRSVRSRGAFFFFFSAIWGCLRGARA